MDLALGSSGLMIFERTLKRKVEFTGAGLHSGRPVKLILEPAPAGHGIVFYRADLNGEPAIPANAEFVTSTALATTVGIGEASVATVEHLLSAIHCAGLDNVKCRVFGAEVPIGDGSALPFVQLIQSVGTITQTKPREYIALTKTVDIRSDDGSTGEVFPFDGFMVNCEIRFDHDLIKTQRYSYSLGKSDYENEICSARTFGFLNQVEALQRKGLALGGGLHNAVVLDKKGVMNPDGLRYSDEFVRHKVLDAIGDIQLLGKPVLGRFELFCSGHELHRELMIKILSDKSCYEIVQIGSTEEKERLPVEEVAYA
jgi:UDP-3-O-[3-hydroxymyristoyl] N-acetylglucosamine deacetylase